MRSTNFRGFVNLALLNQKCTLPAMVIGAICVSDVALTRAQSPVQVKEIAAGSANGIPTGEFISVDNNGLLYFSGGDTVTGNELWKSDGTEAGTQLIKDVQSGATGSSPNYLSGIGDLLYFGAIGANGQPRNVHVSNGTSDGTAEVVGMPTSVGSTFQMMAGSIYFGANSKLWKSDGSAAGTLQVKAISSQNITPVGGSLYFSGQHDGNRANELCISDGTEAGTREVKDIWPGFTMVQFGPNWWIPIPNSSSPNDFIDLNGTVFFRCNSADGQSLWTTDGTEAGTVKFHDFSPAKDDILDLVQLNNQILFSANDGSSGIELWVTDGTLAGTRRLKDINSGTASSSPKNFVAAYDGLVYFSATTSGAGDELWKTDGTEAGTVLVSDIVQGSGSSSPQNLVVSGLNLFFSATTPASGRELWKLPLPAFSDVNDMSIDTPPVTVTYKPNLKKLTAKVSLQSLVTYSRLDGDTKLKAGGLVSYYISDDAILDDSDVLVAVKKVKSIKTTKAKLMKGNITVSASDEGKHIIITLSDTFLEDKQWNNTSVLEIGRDLF